MRGRAARAMPAVRPALIGLGVSVAACLLLGAAFARTTWNPDAFYVRTFEDRAGFALDERSKVVWKWAAPRGIDGTSHYVSAAIRTPGFDPARLPAHMSPATECYESSGGAMRFLLPTDRLDCWHHTDTRDSFFVLRSDVRNILLYKRRRRRHRSSRRPPFHESRRRWDPAMRAGRAGVLVIGDTGLYTIAHLAYGEPDGAPSVSHPYPSIGGTDGARRRATCVRPVRGATTAQALGTRTASRSSLPCRGERSTPCSGASSATSSRTSPRTTAPFDGTT